MDSASLRRGKSRSKSGSPGGMGRRFSVRLSLRAVSSSLPWSRTVMVRSAVAVGELVVVVPAVAAVLVVVAVGADAGERHRSGGRRCRWVRRCRGRRRGRRAGWSSVVPSARVMVLSSMWTFFSTRCPVAAAGFVGAGLGGGDAVDGEQAEVAEEVLVVDAAQGGVVDDALGAGEVWREAGEAVDGAAGFAAGGGDPVDVEDDAAVAVVGAGGDEDELGAPGGVAVAFEVQRRVGFDAGGAEFAGRAVDARVAGLGFEQGGDDLAVGVEHAAEVGMGPGARARRGRAGRGRGPGRRRARGAARASWSRISGSVR